MGVSQASSMIRLDKKPQETRASMIQDVQGVKLLDSCLAVLESSFRVDICLYVLAILDTVCTGRENCSRIGRREEVSR